MIPNAANWMTIATAFKMAPEDGTLIISNKNEQGFEFAVGSDTAPHSSVELFRQLIGERRLTRICQQQDLDLDLHFNLTKQTVHSIFLGMMHIQKEDIEELEGTISERYSHLMPFADFQQFRESFIESPPDLASFAVDKAATSGKGCKGLTERLSVIANHYFQKIAEANQKTQFYRDVEMLTSRLADREMQIGEVIPLRDGYFYVDAIFTSGGAYIAVLRDFAGECIPKVICRGTAMRSSATEGWNSGVNDLLPEMGTLGVKTVWPSLSNYLRNSSFTDVQIMGKSLGGAHAQELALLIEGLLNIRVEKLVTYCSVGVGKEINNLFEEKVLAKRNEPFRVCIIRNGHKGEDQIADFVPTIGGVHLGAGIAEEKCRVKVVYLATGEEGEALPLELEQGFFKHISCFFNAFKEPHCRQTTLGKFSWKKIKEKEELERHLQIGSRLEWIRCIAVYTFCIFTLFYFSGRSFSGYYKRIEADQQSNSHTDRQKAL